MINRLLIVVIEQVPAQVFAFSCYFNIRIFVKPNSKLLKLRLSRIKISPASNPSLRSLYMRNSYLSTLSILLFLLFPFTHTGLLSKTYRSNLWGINVCGKAVGLYFLRLLFLANACCRNATASNNGSLLIWLSKVMERNRCRKFSLNFRDKRRYCPHSYADSSRMALVMYRDTTANCSLARIVNARSFYPMGKISFVCLILFGNKGLR